MQARENGEAGVSCKHRKANVLSRALDVCWQLAFKDGRNARGQNYPPRTIRPVLTVGKRRPIRSSNRASWPESCATVSWTFRDLSLHLLLSFPFLTPTLPRKC